MTSATAAAASLGEAATATPTLAAARAGASFTPSPTCTHTLLFNHPFYRNHAGAMFGMLHGWLPGQESPKVPLNMAECLPASCSHRVAECGATAWLLRYSVSQRLQHRGEGLSGSP